MNESSEPAVSPAHAMDRIVGQRIRELRRNRKTSLDQLSKETGLSIGYLSQMERGMSSPSLRSLTAIADVFGVPIGALFGPMREKSDDTVVLRADEGAELNLWRSGISKQLLTPSNAKGVLNVVKVRLAPHASTGDELYFHQGEEAGLVLSGSMVLTVDNSSFDLSAGDGFRFASTRPHRFSNETDEETVVIWINYIT